MRVLVTGGAGYIGAVIGRKLVTAGHEVSIFDDFSSGYRESLPNDCDVIEGDLAGDLSAAVCDIDAIIHCAGKSLVGESVEKPQLYYRANVEGSARLILAAKQAGVKRFVFSSSAAVYQGGPEPLTEQSLTLPANPYGNTKLAVDHLLLAAGFLGASFRYFNVAGAYQEAGNYFGERHHPETHVIPKLLQATESEPFRLFGDSWPTPDGTCIRDYIHVEDLADAHIAALEHQSFDICNLGSGVGASVKEVLQIAERTLNREIPTLIANPRAGDPAVLVASYEKAKKLFGWEPQKSLEEMIQSAQAFTVQLSSH